MLIAGEGAGEKFLREGGTAVAAAGGNGESLAVAGGFHERDRAYISLFACTNDQ